MSGLHFESDIDKKKFDVKAAQIEQQMENFGRVAEQQGGVIEKGMQSAVRGVAGLAAAYISLNAAVRAGKELVSHSMKLETAMRSASTISQDVTENLEGYTKAIEDLSRTSSQSSVSLASAFKAIISASYEADDALHLLSIADKAAAAGFVDIEVAADGVTTVLNAWGKTVDESERVSDIFFKTIERGKTSFPELASNIATVAPLAASSGVSFEEVSAALQTLTRQGTPTAVAMTQIRAAIVSMNENLGDGWSKTMTFQQGVELMSKKAGGSMNALKGMVGRVEGVNAILAMTGKNTKHAADDLESLADVAGLTGDAFDKVAESTEFQIKSLKNTLLAELAPIGEAAKNSIGYLAGIVDKGLKSGNIQTVVSGLTRMAVALGAVKGASMAVSAVRKIGLKLHEEEVAMQAKALAGALTTQNAIALGLQSEKMLRDEATQAIRDKLAMQLLELRAAKAAAIADAATIKQKIINTNIEMAQHRKNLSLAVAEKNLTQAKLAREKLLTAQKQRDILVDNQKIATQKVANIQTRLDNTLTTVTIAKKKAATVANNVLISSFNKLKAALATNPFGIVIAGISLLIPLIEKLRDKNKEATDSQKDVNKELENFADIQSDYVEMQKRQRVIGKMTEDQIQNEIAAIEDKIRTEKEYGLVLAANYNAIKNQDWTKDANVVAKHKQWIREKVLMGETPARWQEDQMLAMMAKEAEVTALVDYRKEEKENKKRIEDYERGIASLNEAIKERGKVSKEVSKRTIEAIDKEIDALKEQQRTVAETNAQYMEFQQEINKLEAERERITGVEPKAAQTFEEQLREIKQAYEDYETQKYLLQEKGDTGRLGALEKNFEAQKGVAEDYIQYLEKLWANAATTDDERKIIASELKPYYEQKAKQRLDDQKAEMEALQRIVEENQKAFDQRAKQHKKYLDDRQKLEIEAVKLKEKLKDATGKEAEEIRERILGIDSAIDVLDTKVKFSTDDGLALYNRMYRDVSNANRKMLREQIAAIEEYLLTIDQTNDDWDALNAKLAEAKKRLKELPMQEARILAEGFRELGGAIEAVNPKLGVLVSLLGDTLEIGSDIAKVAKTGEGALELAINSAVKLGTMVVSQLEKNKQAQEAWNESILQTAHNLKMLQLESLDYAQSNIFGVENPYARAMAGAAQYAATVGALRESLKVLEKGQIQVGTKKVVSGENIAKGTAYGAGAGAGVGAMVGGPIGALIGAGIGALVGAGIGALSRETVPVMEGLVEKFGYIFDFDKFEINKELLASYDQLDDATQRLVDNFQELIQKAKDARDELSANFKDLAGDVGSQLSKALQEAFINDDVQGAMDDFQAYFNGMMENILAQKVFAATFSDLFDQLEEDMNRSFGIGPNGELIDGADYDITDELMRLFEQIPERLDAYMAGMDAVKQMFGGLFEKDEKDEKGAFEADKGITSQITADQASVLVGNTARIMISNEQISAKIAEGNAQAGRLLGLAIERNTILGAIKLDTARLESIERYSKRTADILEGSQNRF